MKSIDEMLDDEGFDEYCNIFINSIEIKYNLGSGVDLLSKIPSPLKPVIIKDYLDLSENEINELISQYNSIYGVSFFYVKNNNIKDNKHIIFSLSEQLKEFSMLENPIKHPMEGHPEAVKRFGVDDDTLKIYNLDIKKTGYIEVAETNNQFSTHSDGLGFAGKVESVILFSESPPLWGGYTYFQNFLLIALRLAKEDWQAFKCLCLPNAISALRPRGKGAILVESPIFYLNDKNEPKVFFRVSSGEYEINYSQFNNNVKKSIEKLLYYASPFSNYSTFVNFSKRGFGCIIDNGVSLHGRTEFIEESESDSTRVLSRKWFMAEKKYTKYMHVPGIVTSNIFNNIFPDFYNENSLSGEWNYCAEKKSNIKIS